MSSNIEEKFDKILKVKNWKNILLRNQIRNDLVRCQFDENTLANYLQRLNDQQLLDIRQRVFNLARDFYFEILILKNFGPKPILRNDFENSNSLNYSLRCHLVQDCLELMEYFTNYSNETTNYYLPGRCTVYSQSQVNFPIGKTFLEQQTNGFKILKSKIVQLSSRIENYKSFTLSYDKMQKDLVEAEKKAGLLLEQNTALKDILKLLLILFVFMIILFIFLICSFRK
ncbi:unnamed protein product [Brachionus calyciflorus]|uniref:Uncharacterized protein n=1 Tax=Brachionus calyciflorus TaxID=104777 RepID=A0A813N9I2_9BILA|nr:unnamed protein product [Brachionus calyciflorus]